MTGAYRSTQFLAHAANDTQSDSRRLGRFRIILEGIGECALVHDDAGDGAPYLPRDIYDALHFAPRFEMLPLIENVDDLYPLAGHRTNDPMIG